MDDFELTAPLPIADFRSIAGPHSTKARTDTWLTPPRILQALGDFDLDPCAAPEPRPWPSAANHFTLPTDGLKQEWFGRVWLNPPYGSQTGIWLQRLADHGNGVALIFARTDTEMFFQQVWERANAVLFLRGRLTFFEPTGRMAAFNAGGPSCLVAYGNNDAHALRTSSLDGYFVGLR